MPRSFLPYSHLYFFPHLHVVPFTQCIYITFFCLLIASTISKLGVVSLLLDSKATITHEALTMMLQIPLVATDTGSSLPGGAEHLRYAVRMGPSEHDISAAIQGIIGYHNWTNLLVMYMSPLEVYRWTHALRGEASMFCSLGMCATLYGIGRSPYRLLV